LHSFSHSSFKKKLKKYAKLFENIKL